MTVLLAVCVRTCRDLPLGPKQEHAATAELTAEICIYVYFYDVSFFCMCKAFTVLVVQL